MPPASKERTPAWCLRAIKVILQAHGFLPIGETIDPIEIVRAVRKLCELWTGNDTKKR